jgi:Lar family restriction alleviation protein
MTEELKPCPFCGSAPGTLARPDNIDGTEFYAAVFCHCEGYSATAHAGKHGKTQDEATRAAHAAWNRRATPSVPSGGPVAWIYQNSNTEREYLVWQKGTGGRNWQPLYAAPQPAPAGWRLVPVEPSKEMQWAGCIALDNASVRDLDATLDEMAAAYRAMLDAAPAAPGGGAGPNSKLTGAAGVRSNDS